MHHFIVAHRTQLIERCSSKEAGRSIGQASRAQVEHGVSVFLDQLTRTLQAEESGALQDSLAISGSSGGDDAGPSEIGVSAHRHGTELLAMGYTIDEVVHAYGDVCQAITSLAAELEVPFATEDFRTLNRCLDNAIALAVLAFSQRREAQALLASNEAARMRIGSLVHELRNALASASLAVHALEIGRMEMSGATGAVLKRSLAALKRLVSLAVVEVDEEGRLPQRLSVADFMDDAAASARLAAEAAGCALAVGPIDEAWFVRADASSLHGSLANLLQNAFKFSRRGATVSVVTHAMDGQVHIEVRDACGGLPPGSAERMFTPFTQRSEDRSGMGIGLSIARRGVESDFGTLTVRDFPGVGCAFTISLPLLA